MENLKAVFIFIDYAFLFVWVITAIAILFGYRPSIQMVFVYVFLLAFDSFLDIIEWRE